MKVLHFTTTVGGGGAENMLCNLVEKLAERGVSNIVVSTTSSLDDNSLRPRLERSAAFFDLQADSLLSLRFLSAFASVLRREKPDIVQTWMHTAGLAAGIVARSLGLRHIVWGIHSKDLLRFENRPRLRSAFGRLLGFGAACLPRKIVSCSRIGMEIHHRQYGYPSDKMMWIGNGIDTGRYRPDASCRSLWRNRLQIPETAHVIGMVTRFHPVKDVATFLRAVALLQRSREDAHFVFCGDTLANATPEIAELARTLPDPSRFYWLGFQPDTEKVYPLLDILTVTSISEAYPMVLIEAMACGVPCVSTDVGDASLILGELGRVAPVQNPELIANAWSSLLQLSANEREALRERVRERAVAEFGLDACAAKYQRLYQELAA